MFEKLWRSDFADQLNKECTTLLFPDIRVALELVEVGPQRPSPKLDNYSLLFRGPAEFCLLQSSYPIEHPVIGTLDLFIVPVNEKPDGFRYEAIINRIVG
jgi:hypothetical protein